MKILVCSLASIGTLALSFSALSAGDVPDCRSRVIILGFLEADGWLEPGLFTDGTRPLTKGYEVLADAIEPVIERLIQAGPVTP